MAKTIDDVVRGLKLRATPEGDVLTVLVGRKRVALPFEAKLLRSDEYVFVQITPQAGVFKLSSERLLPVGSVDEAVVASKSFRQRKERPQKVEPELTMPAEVSAALNRIPRGYRIAMGADGQYKLVKTRARRKKVG